MNTNTKPATGNFTEVTCPACGRNVSVAHVPGSYTCERA